MKITRIGGFLLCCAFALFVLVIFPGCSTPQSLPPEAQTAGYARVVKITTEVEYGLRRPGWIWDEAKTIQSVYSGCGFLCSGRIVTAKHVALGPDPRGLVKINDHLIGEGGYIIESRKIRVLVSEYGYHPTGIWVSENQDIAVLEMPLASFDRMACLGFELRQPKVEDYVRVWGFPGTNSQQMTDRSLDGGALRVVDIQADYIVLNGQLDAGYSGGPVLLTENNGLVGIVSRAETRQTRAVRLRFSPSVVKMTSYDSGGVSVDPMKQVILPTPK